MVLETLIAFVVLANGIRITPVVPSIELSFEAQIRADELCASHTFSHDTFLNRYAGYNYGEVLAKGFKRNPQAIEYAWEHSPTHRQILTDPRYSQAGVGQACDITVELFR